MNPKRKVFIATTNSFFYIGFSSKRAGRRSTLKAQGAGGLSPERCPPAIPEPFIAVEFCCRHPRVPRGAIATFRGRSLRTYEGVSSGHAITTHLTLTCPPITPSSVLQRRGHLPTRSVRKQRHLPRHNLGFSSVDKAGKHACEPHHLLREV